MRLGAFASGCAAALLVTTAPVGAQTGGEISPPAGRPPSWSDEFAGSAVDPAKWGFETERNRDGWYNGERQYYTAGAAGQANVANGALTITAARTAFRHAPPADWGGQPYMSARLSTKGRAAWTQGFFEIRAKLPCGRGMWPAVWMLPVSGTWPAGGEIDIAELIGAEPDMIHGTLHYADPAGTHRMMTEARRAPDACHGFHTYQLEWRADRIRLGIDRIAYADFETKAIGNGDRPTFDRPFYLILDLAVGGSWGGKAGIDDAALPQSMVIDYVRVWSP